MRFGVADYGMNVWFGGCHDIEERLARLREIGYEGIERVEAGSAAEAVERAARYRRLGMDFGTCRGPNMESSIRWAAGLGKSYVWVGTSARDFATFCRQTEAQAAACQEWGLRPALHNHLGTPVETPEQLERFLLECPNCALVLDTAHLAAAGGDPVSVVLGYHDRLAAVHLKDWLVTNPNAGLDRWTERGRFCELGAGNAGLDNRAVLRALRDVGYDGWVFVEQDTHLRDPYLDLAVSLDYIRSA